MGIDFQRCEEAKQSVDPQAIRKLANVAMTDEVKRYQDLVDNPEAEAENEGEETGAPSPGTEPPRDIVHSPQPPQMIFVNSPYQYIIVRQEVAYAKQEVILAPPAAYAPGTSASRSFVERVRVPQQNVATYERSNPQIVQKGPGMTWSGVRQQARQAQARRRFGPGVGNGQKRRRNSRGNPPARNGRGRRKRRWP